MSGKHPSPTRASAGSTTACRQLVSPYGCRGWVNRRRGADELARIDPRRSAGTVTAFASALTAMFIEQQSTLQLLDRIPAPVLLLWSTNDPLIDQPSYRRSHRVGVTGRVCG